MSKDSSRKQHQLAVKQHMEWLVKKAVENPREWIPEISERSWFKVGDDLLEKWVEDNLSTLYLITIGQKAQLPKKQQQKAVKLIVKELKKHPELYLAWSPH